MLGLKLETLLNKVKEQCPPINQEVEARHQHNLADDSEEWLEYGQPNNLLLWREGAETADRLNDEPTLAVGNCAYQ
jgi:hypothetical protein